MAGIFISHSSKNNAEAERLRDWLEQQGWGRLQVFLDLQDLKSGDRWRDVLNGLADCEAVIICLSNDWLASSECVREFTKAEDQGKDILLLSVAPVTSPIPRFITDLQIGDTSPSGMIKLRDQLFAKRITPQSFPWPPNDEPKRLVYRGLQALDVQDAAIFFGRDADILRGINEIRALRSGGSRRMLVILGASGAGKSSFLRAGLIARLKRDEENFLVMPIIRPDRAAISGHQGLAASAGMDEVAFGRRRGSLSFDPASGIDGLVKTFAARRTPVMERLQRNAQAAGETYSAKPPTIVIPIDQAEELFSAEGANERSAFCEVLAGALNQDGNALVITTIRSDSYEQLQVEPHLAGTGQLLFNLPPIPVGSFQEIIEGPARLAKPPLAVEPALTQRLLADLDAADALPLLAFTLERLQSQYGSDGELALADYEELGGLSGAIQSAVGAVLGPQPTKETLALARRLFVPNLVHVDQGGVKRRAALRADLPADTQPLVDQFITQRLLVSDAGRIEVAHEAVLRQWPGLASWITDERLALATWDAVRSAAEEWRAHNIRRDGKGGESWLAHRGDRLKEAEAIAARADFAGVVDTLMRLYLAACRRAERRAAASRRRMQVLAGVSALAVIGLGYAYTQREALESQIFGWWNYERFARSSHELRAAAPGITFQDCREGSGDCPVMVVIPEGTFLMGQPEGETSILNYINDERPQRHISIRRFAVSRTEITFADWRRCFDAGGCGNGMPDRSGWEGDNLPVINVSWNDAQNYAAWLSRMTGHEYRLLTEAEWEYAARAGTDTAYPWGNQASHEYANYGTDQCCNGLALGRDQWLNTAPVQSFPPNAFGLYDMHGNVWEWVEDCFAPYDPTMLDGAAQVINADPNAASDGEATCPLRVLRGGSWSIYPELLRSAHRYREYHYNRISNFGFRVARTL
jgi:formylglycine-generating enzyme required for sulfatase activity